MFEMSLNKISNNERERLRNLAVLRDGKLATLIDVSKWKSIIAIAGPKIELAKLNDGFIAMGVGIVDYDMWIIDRWGKQIFHSSSINQPWDGTAYSSDSYCQNDVYEYIIKVHDNRGKEHKYIGHVTLVR